MTRRTALLALTVLASSTLPSAVSADTLLDGATVRVRSPAIESGWHSGRIKRDDRHCSMVQLDRPTEHGYTLIALMTIDALQVGHTGAWTALDARQAIAAEPAHCLIEGTD